ncbi:unnamed protein product [Anisakis simplex]|uniref:Cysteine dioxygenase n=1 Tax=Anisakis simplex TaxID=6269 RepID=A0A0M3IY24_ANISI|nr:unnamed protein product [Anisakis simplex]
MEILCERIRRIFQEDQIDVQEVEDVFRAYKSNPDDWSKFAQFNDNTYTRNLVDVGNGKYNLMILCWGPGMGSSIHSHTDAHCFVKMLDGALLEQRFEWPSSSDQEQPLKQISSNVCAKNDVTYICDELGLHRMENPSHVDNAVSLHLYIPPFQECHSFDQVYLTKTPTITDSTDQNNTSTIKSPSIIFKQILN